MNLKPCPFCGSTELGVYFDKRVEASVVSCRDCGGNIQRETKKEAVEAWNRRATND